MHQGKKASATRTVLIPSIDAIKGKNLHQLDGLGERGFRFLVLTTDTTGSSERTVAGSSHIQLHISPKRWKRSWFIFKALTLLWSSRISVAEVYPGFYIELALSILIKLRGVPIIMIARGEGEFNYAHGKGMWIRRAIFRLTYAMADYVIYKEPYMKEVFDRIGKRNKRLLPNAVQVPNHQPPEREGCSFLFLNSIRELRHPELALRAFLEICSELGLTSNSSIRFRIVGMDAKGAVFDRGKEGLLRSLIAGLDVPVELHAWTDSPSRWMEISDVFLLPADRVFLNFALIEAMSYAIPPIISDVDGAELIVEHGVEGFVLPKNQSTWKDHMLALIRDVRLRKSLGMAAREKLEKKFSHDAYLRAYEAVYDSLVPREGARSQLP